MNWESFFAGAITIILAWIISERLPKDDGEQNNGLESPDCYYTHYPMLPTDTH